MDVHKESITIAVLPADAKGPARLDRLPNDLPKLKKWIARVAREGELRACYEASGAGYALRRAFQAWGYACAVIAPSLIPKRSGVQRKHDKRDATDLARLYRAGELVAVRIPSEAEERAGMSYAAGQPRCRCTSAIGVYQQDQPSMLPRAHVVPRPPCTAIKCTDPLTPAQSYQLGISCGAQRRQLHAVVGRPHVYRCLAACRACCNLSKQ